MILVSLAPAITVSDLGCFRSKNIWSDKNHCCHISHITSAIAVQYVWQYVSYYISPFFAGQPIYSAAEEGASTCAGPLHADPLPTECIIDAEVDDIDDDGLYVPAFLNPPPTVSTTAFPTPVYIPVNGSQQFSCQESLVPSAEPSQEPTAPPTLRPTTKPTVRHTAYPTAAAPTVATFYASQVSKCVDVFATFSDVFKILKLADYMTRVCCTFPSLLTFSINFVFSPFSDL